MKHPTENEKNFAFMFAAAFDSCWRMADQLKDLENDKSDFLKAAKLYYDNRKDFQIAYKDEEHLHKLFS